MTDAEIASSFYSDKSDIEIARHINLALLMSDGISEQNAGFDTIVSLNDKGIAAIERIIGKVREAARLAVFSTSYGPGEIAEQILKAAAADKRSEDRK